MSALPETYRIDNYHVNIQVREQLNKFGGLDRAVALQQAELCLQGDKLRVVQSYLGGMGVRQIVAHSGLVSRTVETYLEQAKEDVARFYIESAQSS